MSLASQSERSEIQASPRRREPGYRELMVQGIENRTTLRGQVRGRRADPDRPGWELLDIDVARADPVPGLPNLLARTVGSTITVSVPADLLPGGDLRGASLRFRAYRGGPDAVLAEKDPAPGAFIIDTGH